MLKEFATEQTKKSKAREEHAPLGSSIKSLHTALHTKMDKSITYGSCCLCGFSDNESGPDLYLYRSFFHRSTKFTTMTSRVIMKILSGGCKSVRAMYRTAQPISAQLP